MSFDWASYAVGGATRPDSFSGMSPDFQSGLMRLFEMAPDNIRQQLQVKSGYRSVGRQKELWEQALKKYGSPEAVRKWVAPPGRSQHGHGNAADLGFLTPDARAWAHANAKAAGLAFPLGNEPWHIELANARNQAGAPPQALSGIGSPTTPSAGSPTLAGGTGGDNLASPIPPWLAEYANTEEQGKQRNPFLDALANLEPMPAARISGGGGDARASGNMLLEALNAPTAAEMLLKKRMQGIR